MNPAHIEEELKVTKQLLSITKDGRRKKGLEKAVTQLEAAKKEAGNADDLKKLVTALTGVEAMVKNRPEYNKVRTKRTPKVEKKKAK